MHLAATAILLACIGCIAGFPLRNLLNTTGFSNSGSSITDEQLAQMDCTSGGKTSDSPNEELRQRTCEIVRDSLKLLRSGKATGLVPQAQANMLDRFLGSFWKRANKALSSWDTTREQSYLMPALSLLKDVAKVDVAKHLLDSQQISMQEYRQIADQLSQGKLTQLINGVDHRIENAISPRALLQIAQALSSELKRAIRTKELLGELWNVAVKGRGSPDAPEGLWARAGRGLYSFARTRLGY